MAIIFFFHIAFKWVAIAFKWVANGSTRGHCREKVETFDNKEEKKPQQCCCENNDETHHCERTLVKYSTTSQNVQTRTHTLQLNDTNLVRSAHDGYTHPESETSSTLSYAET